METEDQDTADQQAFQEEQWWADFLLGMSLATLVGGIVSSSD